MERSIIFVLPAGLMMSGVTTWSVGLCRRLTGLGQRVGLIQHPDIKPTLDLSIPPGIQRVRCQNQAIPQDFYTEADLVDYAIDYRRLMPAVIVPNGATGTYATCALIASQAPEILRLIGVAHSDEAVYYEWLNYYEPIIHKFIAVSQEIAANLAQIIPHRKHDIVVRPCAVEVPRHLSRIYSPPNEPIQLMYAGRVIEEQKRVSDLLVLVKELGMAQVNFHLRLVGDGPDTQKLLHELQLMGEDLRRRVTWAGRLPPQQMPAAWQAADICILVSEYEGTSVSMLEAMAAGCVPVVTQVSGAANVIRPGLNGFLAPVGQVAEMAQIIKTLEQDRQQLANLGRAAHATIAKCFGYDQYAQWFLELVDEVWQQPPRPWPTGRPLHRQPTLRERIQNLSAEELSQLVPIRKLIKALGFKVAAQPALSWLYHFRGIGKRLLGK